MKTHIYIVHNNAQGMGYKVMVQEPGKPVNHIPADFHLGMKSTAQDIAHKLAKGFPFGEVEMFECPSVESFETLADSFEDGAVLVPVPELPVIPFEDFDPDDGLGPRGPVSELCSFMDNIEEHREEMAFDELLGHLNGLWLASKGELS